MQKDWEARMDKLEEDKNGLKIVIILKTCQPNRFWKFIFAVYNVWFTAWETIWCNMKLCRILQFAGNSSLTLSCIPKDVWLAI